MKVVVKSAIAVAGLSIGLLAYMFSYAKKKNVIHHSFAVNETLDQNKELRIFFISDIHRRIIDDQLLEKVQVSGPVDLVIIGGDLAEGGVPLKRIERNIRSLSELGPLYFIWGNNDREVGEDAIRKLFQKYKGTILDNTDSAIANHPFWGICGTDDPSSKKVDVMKALERAKSYRYLIVATHTPALFRKVEAIHTPELMVAGHMHGGQIRIGKYSLHPLGRFSVAHGKARLISNGYGTSLIPLRLGAAPESHVITINY